jgi:hypothetical protein
MSRFLLVVIAVCVELVRQPDGGYHFMGSSAVNAQTQFEFPMRSTGAVSYVEQGFASLCGELQTRTLGNSTTGALL